MLRNSLSARRPLPNPKASIFPPFPVGGGRGTLKKTHGTRTPPKPNFGSNSGLRVGLAWSGR
eukprot:8256561-Pyramimonas_sp.AAC.1